MFIFNTCKHMRYSERQYIKNEQRHNVSKDHAMLHILSYGNKYPNATKEYILLKHPITSDTTHESIIEEYTNYIKSFTSVSELSKRLIDAKEFDADHPNELIDVKIYPDFTFTVSDLSNNNDTLPDPSIVWEINRISPTFCGVFFENMVTRCLKIKYDCSDLSKLLTSSSPSSVISNDTIINVLERSFISTRRLIHEKLNIHNNKIYIGHQALNKKDFISIWHYIIFVSLMHFIKREFTGQTLEDALNILEYVNKNISYVDDYYYKLKHSTFIRTLRNEYNIAHNPSFKTKELHGELDFLTDDTILDIKVYKRETVDEWFAQLWLYEQLAGKRKHLRILNLYTNRIHSFTY